ncbi:hypothetical protein IF1G_04043 [Cordyceps javanica]|uniref:Uncharacterized protein n=1 Tax=Cordyceps javanica TaxID=43265 RepID=A0A545V515_9HYPO|nr:hypothetical protein IF1G_04043 [Cordyceps javanica]
MRPSRRLDMANPDQKHDRLSAPGAGPSTCPSSESRQQYWASLFALLVLLSCHHNSQWRDVSIRRKLNGAACFSCTYRTHPKRTKCFLIRG